jgi:ABC-type branched-subunit amino acid transport system ATPase component
MTSSPLIDVQRVTKKFGGLVALDDISLKVPVGRISGLIGPNGAGKSTLFNVLTGIFSPDGGQILYEGRKFNDVPPYVRVRMGMVRTFQKIHPFRGMTVLESVMVGHKGSRAGLLAAMLTLPWVSREERQIRDAAHAALAVVGLEAQANELAETLPLGRQRHLQLACAMVTQPRVLLLDEPASGLNTSETAHLADLLLAIREQGTTLVLVEHDMSLVMKICEEITVLCFGRKLAEGAPAEIRRNPAVIKAYLGGGNDNA